MELSKGQYSLMEELLVDLRAEIIQRRVTATSIVERLDVVEHVCFRLVAGVVHTVMHQFALQRTEEALYCPYRTVYPVGCSSRYSTHSNCDLVGLGVTSIGMVGPTYSQNLRDIDDYYAAIDGGHLPIQRGLALSAEDRLRRDVITRLICHFRLDMQQLGEQWGIDFHAHFAAELAKLAGMEQDGLLRINGEVIEIAPRGRFLIRNICMVFDAYLADASGGRFSKVI